MGSIVFLYCGLFLSAVSNFLVQVVILRKVAGIGRGNLVRRLALLFKGEMAIVVLLVLLLALGFVAVSVNPMAGVALVFMSPTRHLLLANSRISAAPPTQGRSA